VISLFLIAYYYSFEESKAWAETFELLKPADSTNFSAENAFVSFLSS